MRIISGLWKGRRINDKIPAGIRPTQDAMRETIFNILNNYINFDSIKCADVCAGTGMLGIEALSRGADKTYFIDKNRKAIEYIQNSLTTLKVESNKYKLIQLDAIQFINHYKTIAPTEQLDLIFTDPPYKALLINELLQLTIENSILSSNGIVVAESDIFMQLTTHKYYEILTERQFGISKITILRKI